ncbi:MAG: CBS domain-containing protein [Lysobacterales bacterium]|jgi:CBS domain-containing protein
MKSLFVRDHMSRKVQSVDLNLDILAATRFLVANGISGAPVLDEHGRLVGILTERDCMRVALHSGYHDTPYGLVRDYMTPNPDSVTPEQNILTIAEKFIQGSYRRYPVVDNGRLVGIISRRDVLRAVVKKRGMG